MRMAASQLVTEPVDDPVDIEFPGLLAQLCLKDDMQEKVAELFVQRFGVVVVDGFEDFVGLLNQHGFKGVAILLFVPRATVRPAQPRHDFNELFELCPSHSV